MATPPLEVLLTRLAGGLRGRGCGVIELVGSQWEALDQRAAEHRLQPLLHARWGDHEAVPEAIRAAWGEAYRSSAILALHQRAELLAIVELLARAGIPALALKGAWLAWHAYAAPAERPLRDLDLLVPIESAVAAQELLLTEGFVQDDPGALPLGEWAKRFKHLPALTSPGGTVVELHTRLWDEDGRNPPQPEGLFERAIAGRDHPQLLYPAPPDMLMHLAVHAAFHRFDGGPLMLVDFERLLATTAFDWPAIWQRAASEGWARAAALALAGTDRWLRPGLHDEVQCPAAVPDELLDELPLILAKPQAAREGDIAAAKLARADLSGREKLRRVLARRERFVGLGGFLRWLGAESVTALRGRFVSSERTNAIARLDRWLSG